VVNAEPLHVCEDFILIDKLLLENRVQEDCNYTRHSLLINLFAIWEVTALVHDVFKEKSSKILRHFDAIT